MPIQACQLSSWLSFFFCLQVLQVLPTPLQDLTAGSFRLRGYPKALRWVRLRALEADPYLRQ
jgi:hypothetical protein